MKAIVVYDSRYGNTEKIALDIVKGLRQSQVEEATSQRVSEVDVSKLQDYDLIAVGGPTEFHRASAPMRDFLSKLKGIDLNGKYGFAFDTKLNSRWAGDASNSIEHTLRSCGANILMPKSSAFVESPKQESKKQQNIPEKETAKRSSVVLEEGMEEKFVEVGIELGHVLIQPRTA